MKPTHRVIVAAALSSALLLTGAAACTRVDDASGDSGPDAPSNDGPSDAGPRDASLDAPYLTALRVAPLTLVPAFSPSVHDYSVRCAAGNNALAVSMTAAPGFESTIVLPTPSPRLPSQTVHMSATENQAIVAAATLGAATVEYWVRCLPDDFPTFQWTEHPEAGTPTPGYYLVGTAQPRNDNGSYAVILDSRGVPVWYARVAADPGAGVVDVESLAPAEVSYFPRVDNPAKAKFGVERLSPASTSQVGATGLITDQHELRLLANGDYLAISTPQELVDLTGMKLELFDGGVETLMGTQVAVACNIVEFEPSGKVVWTWSADDHFDPVAASVFPIPYAVGGNVVDPYHCNSVDVDPTNGNLLVSARQMSSIFYIEKSSGTVLWKMGGTNSSKDGARYVSVPDPFNGQHDARFLPGWSSTCNGGTGSISLFDDETYGSQPARAIVYGVVVGPGDGTSCGGGSPGTAILSWHYRGLIPSSGAGSFRISADGSRLIGWGINGSTPRIAFSEVDDVGGDLLDFYFLYGDTTYRAVKVPTSEFDLNDLRNTAGLSP
jgi:hypothetical protein